MNDDERTLWELQEQRREIHCVLRSCCSGAELQVRVRPAGRIDADIVLRELYPTKSDLYERARQLELEYRAGRT
jgi:hypothetical protein